MTHSMARRWFSLFGLLIGSSVSAQVTQRVSLTATGGEFGDHSGVAGVSEDGRYVLFTSEWNGFLRDRRTGTNEMVTIGSSGQLGNGLSSVNCMTPDQRFVVFSSGSSNLIPGDNNGHGDVFLRDRSLGTTEIVSVDSSGGQGNDGSFLCGLRTISDDGRFVCFSSYATNLVPIVDTNTMVDYFVRDRQAGTTELISVNTGGGQAYPCAFPPWDVCGAEISADGRYVAFLNEARNLVSGDTNCSLDIFVRDRQLGVTERVNLFADGTQGWGQYVRGPSISGDGRFVAFSSEDPFVPGDTNDVLDVFVRDRILGTTELISSSTSGGPADNISTYPELSKDGRYVGFQSMATNLVVTDTNGAVDSFVRDRLTDNTELVSIGWSGVQGNSHSGTPIISPSGRFFAFSSMASDLVPGDTNGMGDAFLRDRTGGPEFTSICTPGVAGVMTCPCSNPPSSLGSGCDNSAGTGGAVLSASGGTFLSSDSLVFTTSGQTPAETSIVTQWTGASAAGATFGMGVRCTSGTFKRLYTRTSAAGSITAPDFGAGEPQVSVRSAALGDLIQLAQSRWYVVYYRDPIVLGGCPASSTFNATQTGQVTWFP